jgi:OFA family oxalate/formate antiporter-like MFS transporter
MSQQKVTNRWLVVVGAMLIQLCLGAIYGWGAFTTALQNPEGPFKYTSLQTSLIFSAGLATFALVMILAGRLQDKYGPRIIAIIGGAILGAGYIIAGFTGTSFIMMLLSVGVIGGAGIGLGYVCPIAACVKWFPDLKGLITGLAVAGFGAGAFIFVKLAGGWMNMTGLIENYGVNSTFLIFGIIFAISVIAGAMLLSNPPIGYKPPGWNPKEAKDKSLGSVMVNLTQGQAVRTPQFWMIWLSFVFSAGCGLMAIKCLKNFGELEGGLTAAAAGSALGFLALFNGLGRIVWGTLSHKLTAKYSVVLMCILQAAMMFIMLKMGSTTATLTIAACWLGFNFGGNFALFPLLTLENFGPKNIGANYGAIFSAYGVGGILGPVMAGKVWDTMGTFQWAFIVAGIACIVAALLTLGLRRIGSKEPALEFEATLNIEEALIHHDAVAEAIVTPIPHATKGQSLYAYVTLADGIEETDKLKKELIVHIRNKLGPLLVPEAIQFAQSLPKTRSGKVMRRILHRIAEKDTKNIGDISKLEDPSVVETLISGRG